MSEHPFLRRLKIIAILVAGTVTLGTLGFIFISGYPPFDALIKAIR